ncbi:SPOR domain-containing protein [Verminephrobacter eiseniae]|uniref:SPOR domain-containing protein n=1 Tax=Verminephrobacter eiseniae TaxID=364317 RepID=UPI002238228B|nr:SPOR domain-containing protein [Verminephrobacter eiseniae]MCW5259625.1 SPOR domain-containing protein [Verminephrobacter eiseniae]
MAFFKFRWPGQSAPQPAEKPAKGAGAPTESIEVMRRRARHRLIGAAVLVLAGVIGFPLLFDTQPRPIAVDIPIEIPDRNKVAPLVVPAPAAQTPSTQVPVAQTLPVQTPAVPPTPPDATANGPADGQERLPGARSAAASKPAHTAVTAPAAAPRPTPKPARADDAARALALLEGRSPGPEAAAQERFIVQVGAFADADKARDVRARMERAGLKTYTQVVDTKDGKRTRVRVGPYASRAEADKAAARIKALDLSASILAL